MLRAELVPGLLLFHQLKEHVIQLLPRNLALWTSPCICHHLCCPLMLMKWFCLFIAVCVICTTGAISSLGTFLMFSVSPSSRPPTQVSPTTSSSSTWRISTESGSLNPILTSTRSVVVSIYITLWFLLAFLWSNYTLFIIGFCLIMINQYPVNTTLKAAMACEVNCSQETLSDFSFFFFLRLMKVFIVLKWKVVIRLIHVAWLSHKFHFQAFSEFSFVPNMEYTHSSSCKIGQGSLEEQ